MNAKPTPPALYWHNKDGEPVLIASMGDDYIANCVRMLDRGTIKYRKLFDSYEGSISHRLKVSWAIGEMVGFHPIEHYPAYLGLLTEAFKRNCDFLDERRLIWQAHIRSNGL